MRQRSRFVLVAPVVALAALAACQSAEERAEEHYENAVELSQAGDSDRAIVELRNTLELNPQHIEARRLFAQTQLQSGDLGGALRNYTFIAESLPRDVSSRVQLARLTSELRRWDDFSRFVIRANEVAPDDPDVRMYWLVEQFRQALQSEDTPRRQAVAEELEQLRNERPDEILIRRVLVDHYLTDQRLSAALDEVDAALRLTPGARDLVQVRLGLLAGLGEEDAVEQQLLALLDEDSSDELAMQSLIRWYASRGEFDKASSVLRDRAFQDEATTEQRVGYVMFVSQTQDVAATRAAISELLGLGQDTEILRALAAGLDFDAGERDKAISELEAIIAGAETSTDTIRDIKVTLARLLVQTGDVVGGRQRLEEVLAEDPTHVEGLKLRASLLVDQDDPDGAISVLRTALDQAPEDPQIMALLARAYLRSGDRSLAGEMLALANETSNSSVEYALRYAQFLREDDKLPIAEGVLLDSLRVAPGNIDLLASLGQVYALQQDWPRLEQVEGTLGRLGSEQANDAASAFRVARLQGQQRSDEAIELLQGLAEGQGDATRAHLAIVRTHLANEDIEAATVYIDTALADAPEDIGLRYLKAGLQATVGDVDAAASGYTGLIQEDPQRAVVWEALFRLYMRSGQFDEAQTALDDALEANPGAARLQWAKAGLLEQDGDIDGAISIYEALYAQNSNSVVIANNLASLISAYRTDQESLDRAWSIARRLRGLEQPAFQDTYGWIAARRGDLEEAISHLEPAAAGLPDDPLVQYHLGIAYADAGRTEDAIAQLRRALEVAGPADTRAQFDIARSRLNELEAAQTETPGE
jgi:predicted Zn-dependent protease